MRDPLEVLASIPGFARARLDITLSQGPTNNSYRVEKGGEFFVLRLDKPEAVHLGLDRVAELSVIETVAVAGLGAEPVYFDAETGVYLRPFVEGTTWARDDLLKPGNLERLAALLRRVHSLPPAGKKFKPLLAAGRYAKQLGTPEAGNLFGQVAAAYALIEPGPPALCHNDLVCHNVLEGEPLALIDWEYAGTGDPFFDLAIVIQHHELETSLAHHFLSAYLQQEPNKEERERLAKQSHLYKALLNLWTLRVTP